MLFAGYDEFALIATICALLLLIALALVSLPNRARGQVRLNPAHTMAGETGGGTLEVTNLRLAPMYNPLVTVPIDRGGWHADQVHVRMPVLRRGAPATAEFEVPAVRRGVVPVGPAGARRTDPLGFFQRHVTWAAPVDLYVRPRMVGVESLGPGSVRDLEGIPSDEISMSDLSFHALREYVIGDDLRHVHWRSSARTGRLHVRQYHDTRRSHAVILVDDTRSAYADPEDFELALSIAASVVVRVALDGSDMSFVCGPQQQSGAPHSVLDAFCLSALAEGDLMLAARTAAHLAPDASQLIVISGNQTDAATLQEVRRVFAEDVRFLAFRADLAGDPDLPALTAPGLIEVTTLNQLPGLLAAYVRGVVL